MKTTRNVSWQFRCLSLAVEEAKAKAEEKAEAEEEKSYQVVSRTSRKRPAMCTRLGIRPRRLASSLFRTGVLISVRRGPPQSRTTPQTPRAVCSSLSCSALARPRASIMSKSNSKAEMAKRRVQPHHNSGPIHS
jgi:hypothetical protein